MNKLKKIFFITLCMLTPNIVLGAEYIKCGNDKTFPLALANLISTFFILIKILVPVLLVISGMIAFLKVTFSSNVDEDMKKAKNTLVNNIIAAVIIFFVISIVNFAVGLVAGKSNNFMSCVNCFINPDKCPTIDKDDELCPGYIGEDNCNKQKDKDTNKNQETTSNKKVNDFLFVGDSRYVGISTELKSLGENVLVEAKERTGPSSWLENVSTFADKSNNISIMLGVNETNAEKMKTLLNEIHNTNPNVHIYVNSVYHIGTAYTSGYVNNSNIDKFNNEISSYCSDYHWLTYIDVTNGLYDAKGNLKSEYTSDGLHMNSEGNKILVNNIKTALGK